MFKKLCLGVAVVVGLIYGSGNDFGSIKHDVQKAAKANGASVMGRDNGGWGPNS